MKGYKFLKQFGDVFFYASLAGAIFSAVMIFFCKRPFRTSGCMLICVGLALAFANLEVWAEKQMLLARDAEVARKVYKQIKSNELSEFYEKVG